MTKANRRAVLDTELGFAENDMLFPERAYPQQEPWAKNLHDAYKNYLGEIVWPQKLLPLLDCCKLKFGGFLGTRAWEYGNMPALASI